MLFQELPGFSNLELYHSHSLPTLSHIPVERIRGIAELRNLVELNMSRQWNMSRH